MNHHVLQRAQSQLIARQVARVASHHATAPQLPLFQTASVTIDDDNKRATITSVGGAEFEVNEAGIFPVKVGPNGRRLQQTDVVGITAAVIGGSVNTLGTVMNSAGSAVAPKPAPATQTVTTYKGTCGCADSSCKRMSNCKKCKCNNKQCYMPYDCVACPDPSRFCT